MTKTANKTPPFFVILPFVVFVMVLSLVTYAYTKVRRMVAQGDNYLVSNPELAIEKYAEAKEIRPFLYSQTTIDQKIGEAHNLIAVQNKKPNLIVLFKHTATQVEIDALVTQLSLVTNFSRIESRSKVEMYENYHEILDGDGASDLFSFVKPDDFPATLELYLTDSTHTVKVKSIAESKVFVDSVIEVEK